MWRSSRFAFSVRFSARFPARVFVLYVVVAVGVCRAFIGLILVCRGCGLCGFCRTVVSVFQSVGRIFTVVLSRSRVAVLSQVCYCRVTRVIVTRRVTVVLSLFRRVTVSLRYRLVALPSRYRRVIMVFLHVSVIVLLRFCSCLSFR